MSAPVGWTVIKHEPEAAPAGPSNDDLMAIADAVREVAAMQIQVNDQITTSATNQENQIGRRGHLRAVPSSI